MPFVHSLMRIAIDSWAGTENGGLSANETRLSIVSVQGMWGEGGPGTSGGSISRSCPLHRPEAQTMAADALQLVSASQVPAYLL